MYNDGYLCSRWKAGPSRVDSQENKEARCCHARSFDKSLGNSDRAYQTTELLHSMLQDSRVEPIVKIFTSLIDALAKSLQPDAVEQAFVVLRLMEQDVKCLKPDVITFRTLLKCLAASKGSDTERRAEAVLEDMERRHCAGDTDMKPYVIAYTLAIKACFRAGDLARADAVI